MSFQSSVSPNTNEKHASCHLCTLHAPDAPCELYLSTTVFSSACSSSVHSKSKRCGFSFGIRTSGFPFVSIDSDHLLIVQGFKFWIIWCAAACWASSSSVWMACIKLFTVEYSASAQCFSITVSSTGSSGAPETATSSENTSHRVNGILVVAVTWSLNPILAFVAIRKPTLFFIFYWWDSSNIPTLHEQCESWLLLDGFALDVKVTYDTRLIFHQLCGSSILLFRPSWGRVAFSTCTELMSLKSVPYAISLMTLLNVSATPGIVSTRIGSKANVNTGCPCSVVDWISERQLRTEFCFHNGYHSRSSPIIPGKAFCTTLTDSSSVFPKKMDSGNPITTFSVTNVQGIAAATEVKVFPRSISSTTSVPGISASETHLLTMNHMAQTCCTRNILLGRPGIEYLWSGKRLSVDWRIECAFSSLTASSRHLCSNSLLIVLRTVFNTELVLSAFRSSLRSTCSTTSLEPRAVFFLSSMISYSCSEVSWADGLILRRSWNSSRC